MIRTAKPLIALLLVASGALSGCPAPPGDPLPTGDDVVLTREHLATYQPGGTIVITVDIEVNEGVDISAIALVESIPPGWVYVSASNGFGSLPAIRPQQGAEDTLTFVWIQPPLFPYTFTYTLGIPRNASGSATLEGYVEYRQGAGESQISDTLTSTFQAP